MQRRLRVKRVYWRTGTLTQLIQIGFRQLLFSTTSQILPRRNAESHGMPGMCWTVSVCSCQKHRRLTDKILSLPLLLFLIYSYSIPFYSFLIFSVIYSFLISSISFSFFRRMVLDLCFAKLMGSDLERCNKSSAQRSVSLSVWYLLVLSLSPNFCCCCCCCFDPLKFVRCCKLFFKFLRVIHPVLSLRLKRDVDSALEAMAAPKDWRWKMRKRRGKMRKKTGEERRWEITKKGKERRRVGDKEKESKDKR